MQEASHEYIDHKTTVKTMMTVGEKTLQNSETIQAETINMRVEKNHLISATIMESKKHQKAFDGQSKQNQALRDHLYKM